MRIMGIDLTQVDTSAEFELGTVAWDDGGKAYKYVQYKEGTAAVDGVAGEVAYYLATDGYKDSQVTSDLSDSDEIGAGVLQTAMSEDEYGWIQVRGFATLTIALTAGADGDPLTPTGATDGTLDVNVATAANTHICARAGDISDQEIMCDFPL